MIEQLKTFTAGAWRDASGPSYQTEYPADGSTVAELHAATAADVDEAIQTAEVARQRPSWADLTPHAREKLSLGLNEAPLAWSDT